VQVFLAPSRSFDGRGRMVVLSRIAVEVGTFQERIVRWVGGVTARLMRRACSRCELVSAQRAAGGEFGGLVAWAARVRPQWFVIVARAQ